VAALKILYAYSDSRQEDQQETKQALFNIKNHEIIYTKVGTGTEYEEQIEYLWNQGNPFIICEQDIVPTQKDIDDLAQCKEHFCAAKYRLYPCSTGLPIPVLAHRSIVEGTNRRNWKTRWINDDDIYADLWGFGLTKLTPFGEYPIIKGKWKDIDTRLSMTLWEQGILAHLHPEVKHNHQIRR
jgi:hypothetical protein